jgi:hypothetical protein
MPFQYCTGFFQTIFKRSVKFQSYWEYLHIENENLNKIFFGASHRYSTLARTKRAASESLIQNMEAVEILRLSAHHR